MIVKKDKLLYLLLITNSISYLGYYIYSYFNDINVYVMYSNYINSFFDIDMLSQILRFSKDFVFFVMGMQILANKKRKSFKKYFGFCGGFIAYGIFVLLINSGDLLYIVPGVRVYIYLMILTIWFMQIKDKTISINVLMLIVFLCESINIFIGLEQGVRALDEAFFLIGQGSFRFPLLFGGVNGSGGFAVGVCVFIYFVDKYMNTPKILIFFMLFLAFAITWLGGVRSAMINVMLITCIYAICKMPLDRIKKIMITIVGTIILFPIAINVSTVLADRGSIVDVQMEDGRIAVLEKIVFEEDELDFVIGHGIGVGSNTAVNMVEDKKSVILDGTFNVILYQYGIIGLVLSIVLLFFIGLKIYVSGNIIDFFVYMGSLLLQMITGNILETYGFLILIVITYYMQTKSDIFIEGRNAV